MLIKINSIIMKIFRLILFSITIDLRNNSIIDATALLELKPSTKIDLSGNINLSQDSKNKLKERFGNNVTF